jgi:hypothetical protein
LTNEPPEQAVQRAIMAAGEVESGSNEEAQPAHVPPIPIVELPAQAAARIGEQEDDEDGEPDAVAVDDDLVFDEP